jgi:two-component system, LytTR family, sensor histidine kinase AlgZ
MSVDAAARDNSKRAPEFFLPDFCAARTVLAIVLIAALLGVVLALARQTVDGAFWTDLARTSVFLLWTGLLCAAVLCRLRPRLADMPLRPAIYWSLGSMVGTAALVAEAVYWFGRVWAERLGTPSGFFPASHAGFVLPSVVIAGIVSALALRYFYVSHQWRRSIELESRARIHALQARIRPHFLFNSMNTIAALTRTDPVRAEEAVEDLADLFRVSLSDARAQITLREELEIARIYQRIEQLRLGNRLQVRWDVAALPPRAIVPSLLLQPVLENAIGHGIEPLPLGGTVDVRGWVEDASIVIEVTNPTVAAALRRPSRHGNRMALDNIRQRLELAFPGRSGVEVEDAGEQYRVRLRFPRLGDEVASAWTEPARAELTW